MSNLQIYVCDKCNGNKYFRICSLALCNTPGCRSKMTSDVQKHCNFCSATLNICIYCGSSKTS